MFSLKQTLANLADYPPNSTDHLPVGFSAASGLRPLFPAHQTVGISALSRYVFSYLGTAQTPAGNSAEMSIIADGAGRWNLAAQPNLSPLVISWAGGFVFTYSDDGAGHGYAVANNDVSAVNVGGVGDPWLPQNWPLAFAGSADLWIWDETSSFISALTKPAPAPVNEAATNYGFNALAPLTMVYDQQLPVVDPGLKPDGPDDPKSP